MKICAHCGDEMRGYAMAGDRWLCHPDPPHLDCYHLVTVWGHDPHPGCRQCEADRKERERVTAVARSLPAVLRL